MSELTNEMSKTTRRARRPRRSETEYKVYLGLIFLVALPFCAASWAFSMIQEAKAPSKGPIQAALSEARAVTPMIFSA
ncbi:cytochrome PufQ [Sulfitobacter sp.]|uniref:cytochrome PufQ n=1 Tax=Sulfitobacter sp. TaxID=1903071 RepID=UPI004058B9DA